MDTYEIINHIHCKIVEDQEDLIVRSIQNIGGDTFIDITIDKGKVFEALLLYKNIVRCKDCAYYLSTSVCVGAPGMASSTKRPYDYCSRGVKRDPNATWPKNPYIPKEVK